MADDLVYELDEWEPDERDALSDALDAEGVPFSWEGTTLVVRAHDEARVEQILDAVDEALDLELDPGSPQVGYDLSAWDDVRRDELEQSLIAASVPHQWDDHELQVHEQDEQAVDLLIDSAARSDLGSGDAPDAGAELLGELFVAGDRLLHDARDHEGTLTLIDALRMAEAGAPPYGIDDREWTTILETARRLVRLVESPTIDDDAVIDLATGLRNQLRPLV